MEVRRFRQDKPAILEGPRPGERPLMATTMAPGPLDEGVALHIVLDTLAAEVDAAIAPRGRSRATGQRGRSKWPPWAN